MYYSAQTSNGCNKNNNKHRTAYNISFKNNIITSSSIKLYGWPLNVL